MKNKTKKRIGIVAAMLGVVVAIGATAGTTLAKYISSATVTSQTATVAAWGYTLTADVSKMFGAEYGEVADSYAKVSNNDTVVASADSRDVVAPGTKGEMKFTVNGYAEVNAILTIDLSTLKLDNVYLPNGDNGYYPIKWYVGETAVEVENNAVTVADFVTAIKDEVENELGEDFIVAVDDNKVHVFLPANISVSDLSLSISWEWDFEATSPTEPDYADETNIKDTLLGLISYGAEYSELPENVVTYIQNYYAGNFVAAVDTAKAEVEAKQAAVDAAKAEVEAKQAAVDTAKAEVEAKETKLNNLESYGKETAQYKQAEEELATAKTNLETVEGELTTAKTNLETAEDNLDATVKSVYEYLVGNSNIKISFGFSATIVQTQQTEDEFSAQYMLNQD